MSAPPSTEDLARLAEAITPGPWRRNIENTVCNQIDGEHHAICTDQFCYAPEEQQDANAEANARLIAAAPDMHATILALCDELDELRAENERLHTIIDNLHAVEQKHRETANAEFHRANRLQVEKGRLRGLLAEAIQCNWNDFEETPTESSEACLPLLVDLHQRITSALAQKGGQ